MSYSIPTKEPTTITAGMSLQWSKSLSDYKASDGWTLKYNLIPTDAANNSNRSITASADGDDHAISVTASTTADWGAGNYRLVGYVTDDTDKHIVYDHSVFVRPDPTTATADDYSSFEAQALKAAKTAYKALIGNKTTSVSINGKSYSSQNITELLTHIRNLESAEAARRRVKVGKSPITTHGLAFK